MARKERDELVQNINAEDKLWTWICLGCEHLVEEISTEFSGIDRARYTCRILRNNDPDFTMGSIFGDSISARSFFSIGITQCPMTGLDTIFWEGKEGGLE